jgi:hypothetical protein
MNMVTSSEPPTSQVYDININSYSPTDLRNLCTKLESMTKLNQVEVLRIFHKYNKELINENNYGIHINITDIEDYVLQEIEEYIKYVTKQEGELDIIESQQHTNEPYILKDNKDTSIIESNHEEC